MIWMVKCFYFSESNKQRNSNRDVLGLLITLNSHGCKTIYPVSLDKGIMVCIHHWSVIWGWVHYPKDPLCFPNSSLPPFLKPLFFLLFPYYCHFYNASWTHICQV